MRKGIGRSQQIRGHKRIQKVLKSRKRRNPNKVKPNPGELYLSRIFDDIKGEETNG